MSDQHKHPAAGEPHGTPEFQSHNGLYLGVGALLLAFTGLTVALSYWDFGHEHLNIFVGMLLATVKAIMVAAVFMHLKGEKKTITQTLVITCIFCIGLFALTLLAFSDHIKL